MTDSALLKVDRAAKHVAELNRLFSETPPFSFVVETNTKTGQRTAGTRKNEAIVNTGALICGDVVHNLRSALDHIFWEVVSPRCAASQHRAIQFPFAEKANGLERAIQNRFAHYAGTGFYCAIRDLKPHPEPAGNELLYLIHEMDIVDKHKLLIPTIDYAGIDGGILQKVMPGVPVNITHTLGLGGGATVTWQDNNIASDTLGTLRPPSLHIFERKVDVPISVNLDIGQPAKTRPMIRTLNQMVDAARETVAILRKAAASC